MANFLLQFVFFLATCRRFDSIVNRQLLNDLMWEYCIHNGNLNGEYHNNNVCTYALSCVPQKLPLLVG